MTTRVDPKKILLAEDDGLFREGLRARLVAAGYDVHVATNGAEALERVVSIRPDVMVLDLNMPEIDGFHVLEALHQQHSGLAVPVLVLSSRQQADAVQRALALGARDYVLKSQAETDLLRRIQRLLKAA